MQPPASDEIEHLRVLIANERKDRLALVAAVVVGLGHEVIAREIDVEDVGPVTARERPDVALVGLGDSSAHALDLIDRIVREASCPVIVLLHARDPEFVKQASRRGVFAHINDPRQPNYAVGYKLNLPPEYLLIHRVWGGTFHRIANLILRRHAVSIGFESNYSILDSEDARDFINVCIDDAAIDTKKKRFPKAEIVQSIISYANNTDQPVDEVIITKYPYFEMLTEQIKRVDHIYQSRKQERNVMDYDDLLLQVKRLLIEKPDIAAVDPEKSASATTSGGHSGCARTVTPG